MSHGDVAVGKLLLFIAELHAATANLFSLIPNKLRLMFNRASPCRFQMSLIGLTESVRGDPRRFEVWLQGRADVHTFQAATVEIKAKWVTEIKKVLMNQLEELKDEKIKQYGNANHR